jgi:hypothetical protein
MTKRLKVLLSVLIVVAALAVVVFVYFGKQVGLNASADTMATYTTLVHHPETSPGTGFNALNHDFDGPTKNRVTIYPLVLPLTEVGNTQQLTAKVDGVTNPLITWYVTSMEEKVHGTIDAKTGLYTATSVGTDFIGAMYNNGEDDSHITAVNIAPKYTISATAGKGGKITPTGVVQVATGKNQAFTITPDKGFQISSVLLDQKAGTRSSSGTYSFNNVTANHTISATFTSTTPVVKPVPATASGMVTKAGKALAGATVQVFIVPAKNYLLTGVKTPILLTTTTDTKGAYKVSGLAAGTYSANVSARICTKYWFYTSCANKVKTFSFVLTAGKNTVLPTSTY